MQFFAAILSILAVLNFVAAYPVEKRFYQPSSPVFSLIAHHQGAVFQYHLVKFDGHDLTLADDVLAFFGRIKANNGYVLNIPKGVNYDLNSNIASNYINATNYTNATSYTNATNSTILPSPQNVYIDKNNKLTTTKNNTSTEHFGISHSLLTYKNSTKFLACPTFSYRRNYDVYFNDGAKKCPRNATGYDITLMVQVDATVNYTPETNKNMFKRMLRFFQRK
jgi:hypothetical protein